MSSAGVVRGREGTGTALACPHGHFPTGDGHWVALACTADRMFERHEKLMNLHEHRATRQLEREQEINALHDRRKAELEAWRRKHENEIDSRVTQINKAAGDLAEMLKQAPQKIEQKQLPPASERADEFDRVYARAQLNPIQAIGALLVGLHEAYVDATAYPGGSR